ncbi:hypothetical protein ANO11243_047490 [Dothideomycetidae sp. 11243]|nr:hypothetical protein ANO11243_047490 [fungal sp. No.11243]
MAVATSISPLGLAALRAISLRIASAKTVELPHIVASQVHSLKDCGDILSQSWSPQSGDAGAEVSLVVHRLLTQIASLLQGRQPEERWAAAVLIKAVVEAGGFEMLSRGKHWVSGLVGNLRRPDPSSSRALYAITLTRIFMLTWAFPSLVREMTTPALPQFIKTCLSNISSTSTTDKERRTVLECLLKLIPHHPTVFRSYIKEIQVVCDAFGGPNESGQHPPLDFPVTTSTRDAAARLGSIMHSCAAKQGSTSTWESSLSTIIVRCHEAADVVLAGVDEVSGSRESKKTNFQNNSSGQSTEYRVRSIYQATSQLNRLMHSLAGFIITDSGNVVTIAVPTIQGLLSRLLTVVVSQSRQLPKFNAGSSGEDRDACLECLPRIHVAALETACAFLQRFERAFDSLGPILIQQIGWLFSAEAVYADIRTACYSALKVILSGLGLSMSKELVDSLGGIIKHCCTDVLSKEQQAEKATLANSLTGGSKHSNGTSELSASQPAPGTSLHGLQVAASEMLEVILVSVPRLLLPDTIRSQIDRTAVLSGQTDLLVASVMNPSKRKDGKPAPSLLPFLARKYYSTSIVEALLRPRAPVLQSGSLQSDEESWPRAVEQTRMNTDTFEPPSLSNMVADTTLGKEPGPSELVQSSGTAASYESIPRDVKEVSDVQAGVKRSVDLMSESEVEPNNDSKRARETGAGDLDIAEQVPLIAAIEAMTDMRNGLQSLSGTESSRIDKEARPSSQQQPHTAEESDDDDFVVPDIDMDEDE